MILSLYWQFYTWAKMSQKCPKCPKNSWQWPVCGQFGCRIRFLIFMIIRKNYPKKIVKNVNLFFILFFRTCPGKAVGVKVRLDNSVQGFIPIKNLSDSAVINPEERVQMKQSIYCRIVKINPEKFSIDAICKSSGKWHFLTFS